MEDNSASLFITLVALATTVFAVIKAESVNGLESRGVSEKPREKNQREMISLSFPVHDFR